MSRRNGNGLHFTPKPLFTADEQQEIDRSLDLQMIEYVKELLCTLWKQGRITTEVRTAGDAALGAARHATECAPLHPITYREGLQFSNRQWYAKQEVQNDEF